MTAVAALGASLLLLPSCSNKTNTPASRRWQEFTTRYNVYYNGDTHLKETLAEMERTYEDDYSRILPIHPAEARTNSDLPQPSGDFKRTIEKMQKAIQQHSITKRPVRKTGSQSEKEFRSRAEFNPFIHNAWLTMGKAQYYDGDFEGAAETFVYIARTFTWLPETVTEARLRDAMALCALGRLYEAENAIHPVKEKHLTSAALKDLHNHVMADLLLRKGEFSEAAKFLAPAAEAASGAQKHRLWFLCGQALEMSGQKGKAFEAYTKAAGGISTPYRTKFNSRLKQSDVYSGSDVEKELKSLTRMLRYGQNKPYEGRIRNAIGNLNLILKDTAEAEKNYLLAASNPPEEPSYKALPLLALARLHLARRHYAEAQPHYSAAAALLPDNFPGLDSISLIAGILDRWAVYNGNVTLQDSLLALAALPERQRLEVCRRLADEYLRREQSRLDSADMAKRMEESQELENHSSTTSAIPGMRSNNDKSWYFYNPMTRNAGKAEFQRKWGSRKLEDNWRRRNKTTFSFDSYVEGNVDLTDSIAPALPYQDETITENTGPDSPGYYLRQIPSTPREIKNSNDIVQEGLFNMALILKDELNDYEASREQFSKLNSRYPDNIYRLDAYYNLFLMAARQGKNDEADMWRQKIVADFPDSPYGSAMRNPGYLKNLTEMNSIQEKIYEDAYNAFIHSSTDSVHQLTARMERDYPLSHILPKFVFIDAFSYLPEGRYDEFRSRLEYLLTKWPDTDMTSLAGAILKGLQQGRTPHGGLPNSMSTLWETRLTADPLTPDTLKSDFKLNPYAEQYLVMVFPLDSINPNSVLFETARFNFSTFTVRDFDLEQMAFSNVGLLLVKGFRNLKELNRYAVALAKGHLDFPESLRIVKISKEDFELLLRESRSFEEYFRFKEEAEADKTEDRILSGKKQ